MQTLLVMITMVMFQTLCTSCSFEIILWKKSNKCKQCDYATCDNVGDASNVELFNDENDKPRGCGILEFSTEDLAKNAVEKMHRYEYKGRKIVVKEDFDTERDKYGRITKGNRSSGGDDRQQRSDRSERRDHGPSMGGGGGGGYGNTYGLSPQFLGMFTSFHKFEGAPLKKKL